MPPFHLKTWQTKKGKELPLVALKAVRKLYLPCAMMYIKVIQNNSSQSAGSKGKSFAFLEVAKPGLFLIFYSCVHT